MSITSELELIGIKKVSDAVALHFKRNKKWSSSRKRT